MKSYGDGARFFVDISRKDVYDKKGRLQEAGTGHIFNAEVHGGKVWLIDTQTTLPGNFVNSDEKKAYAGKLEAKDIRQMIIIRVDDVDMDYTATCYAQKAEAKKEEL